MFRNRLPTAEVTSWLPAVAIPFRSTNRLSAMSFLKYIPPFLFLCCQKLAIHPYKRNPSCCHLRFLLCKGIAALADDKQRSMTRYRQQ